MYKLVRIIDDKNYEIVGEFDSDCCWEWFHEDGFVQTFKWNFHLYTDPDGNLYILLRV